MKCTIKTFPCKNCTDACACDDPKDWVEDFEKETVPYLLQRIQSFKDTIPIDVVIRIIQEEILG